MNKTILYDEHLKLHAKIVEFGGFQMPVYYDSIINEHLTVRNNCGIFDVSHMGIFFVKGRDATPYLQYLVTNNPEKIKNFKAIYSPVCNEQGGIVDDIIIYKKNQYDYLIVVNASNTRKDFLWFTGIAKNFSDVLVTDMSDSFALLAVQGPKTKNLMNKLGLEINDLEYYNFKILNFRGKEITISYTGYTGETGYELFIPNNSFAVELWNDLLDAGKEFDIKPVGLGARDTLRLEVCFSLYGHELKDDVTPFEAGISWTVDMTKENFTGKSAFLKNKGERKLVGFEMIDRAIPREGYSVYCENKKAGAVTSGSYLPVLKKNMGLALIDKEFATIGRELAIEIREKKQKAVVVKTPFYPPFNKRKN